jgi:hypothetical protein
VQAVDFGAGQNFDEAQPQMMKLAAECAIRLANALTAADRSIRLNHDEGRVAASIYQ